MSGITEITTFGAPAREYGALLAGFDAAQWAGERLFSRDAPVTAPADMPNSAYYPDAVSFLNGWGSQVDFNTWVNALWSLSRPGSWAFGVNASGLVVVAYVGPESPVNVIVLGRSAWGFAGVTALTGGAATATYPWARGTVTETSTTRMILQAGTEVLALPGLVAQSIPTVFAAAGSDADAVTETLEKWDNDANDPTDRRIRWGVDNEGRTFTSRPTGVADVTWTDTAFAVALGFSGFETATTIGDNHVTVSTWPALGVQVARNRLATIDYATTPRGAALDTLTGSVVGRPVQTLKDQLVTWNMAGGMGATETAAAFRGESELWRERNASRFFAGARVTVLPNLGDPRLGQSAAQQAGWHVTPVQQNEAITAISDGVMGRRRCQVAPGVGETAVQFAPNAPRFRTAAVASLRLRLLP